MTIEEAEEIYMAWQLGGNYPADLLPAAILIINAQDGCGCEVDGETPKPCDFHSAQRLES